MYNWTRLSKVFNLQAFAAYFSLNFAVVNSEFISALSSAGAHIKIAVAQSSLLLMAASAVYVFAHAVFYIIAPEPTKRHSSAREYVATFTGSVEALYKIRIKETRRFRALDESSPFFRRLLVMLIVFCAALFLAGLSKTLAVLLEIARSSPRT